MNAIEDIFPEQYKFFCPRKIITPGGYTTPRRAAESMIFNMLASTEKGADDVCKQTAILSAYLGDLGMPTYFIGKDLLHALWNTTPPDALLLSDVPKILPGMIILLPEATWRDGDGNWLEWVGYGRIPQGWGRKFPQLKLDIEPSAKPQFIFSSASGHGTMWGGWMPENYAIKGLIDEDLAPYQSTGEVTMANKECNAGIATFLINVIMYMASDRDLGGIHVETHTKVRDARPSKGIDELWSPAWIGRRYRLKSEVHHDGTHASPRVHWRRGHFRQQRYGPQRTLIKTIYIDYCLVNADKTT